jgi:hypothetical protein
MRKGHRLSGLLACVLMIGSFRAAQASVQVSFNHPERYSDAELRNGSAAPVLRGIESHLTFLGDCYLAPDQVLKVEILDIDLAGRFEPGRPYAADVRVMRQVTWPRIRLRYALEDDAHVVARGEDTIRDLQYLRYRYNSMANDPLRYEKAMLNEWFLTRLGQIVLPDGSPLVSFQRGK